VGLALLVVLAAGEVRAGSGEWTSGGPDGGPVEVLVFDPAASSTLYAGTRHNAVFRSADGAATWNGAGTGLPRLIRSLAVTADGVLLARGEGPGVYRSTDDGTSWQQVLGELATALGADPATAGTAYAGTPLGLVFKTTDGGAGWTSSGAGLPESRVECVVVDPLTPSTLYVCVDGDGVFKSTDGGVSWVAKSQGISGLDVASMVIDPQTPAKLYIATDDGLFKSTNGGDSWTQLAEPGSGFISRLAIDPAVPANLLAAASGRIFRSTDSGASWIELTSGVPPAEISALAIDPASSSILYAGTMVGVIRSDDAGASWSAASSGLRSVRVDRLAVDPAVPSTLYAASSESGIFKSTDGGTSWAPASAGLGDLSIVELALAPTAPATLYAAQQLGLRRSLDGGAGWSDPVTDPLDFGPRGPQVAGLAVDPLDATTLFATQGGEIGPGSGPGFLRSVDRAVSWERVFQPNQLTVLRAGGVSVDPADSNRVLAGLSGQFFEEVTFVSLLYRSLDGGATWDEVERHPALAAVALDHDPLTPGTVYALISPDAGFAVLRSLDGGGAWSDLPVAVPCINDLLPDPVTANTLWVACDPVYTSDDGGATWSMFDDTGFPVGVGGALALARASGSVEAIHAGTPVGVYTYEDAAVIDLAVTKDDGVTEVAAGGALSYSIEVTNLGPADAISATVTDDLPDELTCTWACAGSGGGTCDPSPPAGDLNETVDLPLGATVTFTASCTVSGSAGGPLANTAVATAPVDTVDPVTGNDTATDTDVVLEMGTCGTFDDRHLSDVVLGGSETIEACMSITAGPSVEVTSDVLFRAPVIVLTELSVTGGSFTAVNEVPTP
jgi:uncharacterized repeat protein (TIGR01451 family)